MQVKKNVMIYSNVKQFNTFLIIYLQINKDC